MAVLEDLLINVVQQRRESKALVLAGSVQYSITYGDMHNWVVHLMERLNEIGVSRGSRVCTLMRNSSEAVIVLLAVFANEATLVPLDPSCKAQEYRYFAETASIDLTIGDKATSNKLNGHGNGAPGFPTPFAEFYWEQGRFNFEFGCEHSTATELPKSTLSSPAPAALILHTSGTTGKPKAVPLTQENLMISTNNVIEAYNLTSKDRAMLIMPLFHIHGIVAGLLAPLLSGAAVIISDKGLTPDFWKNFEVHKATWWTATPTHHNIILSFPLPVSKPKARFIRSCSSALSPKTLQQLETRFEAPVLEAYAMTENAHHITSNTMARPRKPGFVGYPCSSLDLKILTGNGEEQVCGYEGEVAIRGPSLTSGYLENHDANASAFTPGGYFKTGDLGKLDEEGSLQLTGRLKEMINKGGEKISPKGLDDVLRDHPAIYEAVSFAIPDEAYGEDVGLAVVLEGNGNLSALDLQDWLRHRVTDIKVPRDIWFVNKIPKTATGKMQRLMIAAKMLDLSKNSATPAHSHDLRVMWGEVLGLESRTIQNHDNFFDKGGNSVLAIKLASLVRSRGCKLDASSVFQCPAFCDMATRFTKQDPIDPSSSELFARTLWVKEALPAVAEACQVDVEKIEDIVSLTPFQKEMAHGNLIDGTWIASYTFCCENISFGELQASFDVVRDRNPILRSSLVSYKGSLVQAILHDQAWWETPSRLDEFLGQVTKLKIKPGSPLVRMAYVTEGDASFFVLTMAHTAMDVWTRAQLYRELEIALNDKGAFRALPEPRSFATFAGYVENLDRQTAHDFYGRQLSGCVRHSYLKRIEGPSMRYNRDTIEKSLKLGDSQNKPHVLSTLAHLALGLTLRSRSGSDRVAFGSVQNGRFAPIGGIDTIMGPTLTAVPIALEFSTGKEISTLLDEVRNTLLQGCQHEALGPEIIQEHFDNSWELLLNCAPMPETDVCIEAPGTSARLQLDASKSVRNDTGLPLVIRVSEQDSVAHVQANFASNTIDPQDIDRFMADFVRYLDAVSCENTQNIVENL